METKIQKELEELAQVVNKEYGDEEHQYDYQLVRKVVKKGKTA